jgi:hypothetical protein
MKKVLLFFVMSLLLLSLTSATTWTRLTEYSRDDVREVTFKNWWGLGGTQGTMTLGSHQLNERGEIVTLEVGVGWQVTMYYDFEFNELISNGLGEVEFIDMKTGKPIERDYRFVYWTVEEQEQYVCIDKLDSKNEIFTDECKEYEKRIYEVGTWKDYNSNDIPIGNIRIGLMVNNKQNDYIDGIWNIGSKKLDRHADWISSLNTGLLGWYMFNETSGNVSDFLGNLTGFTLYNSPQYEADGIIDKAVNFTGQSYGAGTPINPLNYNGGLSFNLWVNLIGIDDVNMGTLFWLFETGSWGSIHLLINDVGRFNYRIGCGNSGCAYSNIGTDGQFTFGEWHMFTITHNSTTNRLYWNGVLMHSGTSGNLANTGTNFQLAKSHTNTMNGTMDEFSIYSKSLTPEEVEILYNTERGCTYEYCPPEPKKIPTLNLTIDKTSPQTYGETIKINCVTDSNSTLKLWINDSDSTSLLNTNIKLGAGYWDIKCNVTENDYWDSATNQTFFTINKATPTGSITGTSPVAYGSQANIEGVETNTGDGDVNYTLWRNGTYVANPDLTILDIGYYHYIFNSTEGANYSASTELDEFFLTVVVAPGVTAVLTKPDNNHLTSDTEILMWANISAVGGVKLGNYTFYVWDSSNNIIDTSSEDIESLDVYNYNATHTTSTLTDGTYKWNVLVCSNDSSVECSFAPSNRTLEIDTTPPLITIQGGDGLISNYIYFTGDKNHIINFTTTDDNLDSCWITYETSNSPFYETESVSCSSGVEVSKFFEGFRIPYQKSHGYNATISANDTLGNTASYNVFWHYKVEEFERTFEESVLFDNSNTFDTWFYTNETIQKVELVYDGVAYEMDFVQSDLWTGDIYQIIYEYEKELGLDDTGINQFYFRWTIGGEVISSNINSTQKVVGILINSGDGTQDYANHNSNHTINFTVIDDELDSCWYYNSFRPELNVYEESWNEGITSGWIYVEDHTTQVLDFYTYYSAGVTPYVKIYLDADTDTGDYYQINHTDVGSVFEYVNQSVLLDFLNEDGWHYVILSSSNQGFAYDAYTYLLGVRNIVSCSSGVESSFTFRPNFNSTSVGIHVNDTVGNLASKVVDWDYVILENSREYSESIYVTDVDTFKLDITTDGTQTPIVYLVYEGEQYLTTLSSGQYVYTLPMTIVGTNTFYWSIHYGSEIINTTSYTQEVLSLTALEVKEGVCSAGLTMVMNFTFYNENNLTSLDDVNVDYNFLYGIQNITGSLSSGSLTGVSQVSLCLNLSQSTTYDIGYGELDYFSGGYSQRRYYVFENTRLSNLLINQSLALLPNSDSTSFLIEVRAPTLIPYTNKYTTLLRWYPSLNEYKVVETGKTDDKGQTVKKIKVEDVDYRIGVYDVDGTLIHLASPIRMVCLSSPCSYTLTVRETETYRYDEINNIQTEITYSNGIFTFTYNDPSQNTEMMILRVFKTGGYGSDEVICSSNSTSFTGILTCNVSGTDGILKAVAYRVSSPERPLTSLIVDTLTSVFQGTFGLFLQLLISLTLIMMGIISPIASIILGIISLVFGVYFFKTITYPVMIGIAILGGIIIHLMRRSTT